MAYGYRIRRPLANKIRKINITSDIFGEVLLGRPKDLLHPSIKSGLIGSAVQSLMLSADLSDLPCRIP